MNPEIYSVQTRKKRPEKTPYLDTSQQWYRLQNSCFKKVKHDIGPAIEKAKKLSFNQLLNTIIWSNTLKTKDWLQNGSLFKKYFLEKQFFKTTLTFYAPVTSWKRLGTYHASVSHNTNKNLILDPFWGFYVS